MKLYPHQVEALKLSEEFNRVAYYYDMGLGKTFLGSEKMISLGKKYNLLVCQKSKVEDWIEHFKEHYDVNPCDLTKVKASDMVDYLRASASVPVPTVWIINYDLLWRRPELKYLSDFTLILDESSLIQNEATKRSRFILNMNPENVILLSGSPTGGKYENLWSQMKLLGWNISKDLFYKTFILYHYETSMGFPLFVVDGYKNVRRLKRKMREYGCLFKKTREVLDLPEQTFINKRVSMTAAYKRFRKSSIVTVEDKELVGENTLTQLLYERQLCGQYCDVKIQAFKDILSSTEDRIVVFYNFTAELNKLISALKEVDKSRPYGVVNGSVKEQKIIDKERAVLFVQYQAGAMGLNLQKANKIVYFTPTLSSELYEQSKKRIHRIGQDNPCFYYKLICAGSVEEHIYSTLDMRKDFTDELFKEVKHERVTD